MGVKYKMPKSKTIRAPRCPNCGEGMVYTFAFAFKEYACLPCGTTEEFICKKEEFNAEEIEKKKELWKKDLHVLGIKKGGGLCALGSECDICPDIENYQYKFYLKGERRVQ